MVLFDGITFLKCHRMALLCAVSHCYSCSREVFLVHCISSLLPVQHLSLSSLAKRAQMDFNYYEA